MNSPKIYFLKNAEGKFYNSRDRAFYSNIANANFERDLNTMKFIVKLDEFVNCEIHEMTEFDFQQHLASETTRVVLAGQYFAQILEQLNMKLPTISQVGKNMHKKIKIALDELTPMTSLHRDFINSKESQTDEVQGHYQEYIETLAKVQIHESAEVTAILNAYFKDRTSILGITKKILK